MTIFLLTTYYQALIFFFIFFLELRDFLLINIVGFFFGFLLDYVIIYQATNSYNYNYIFNNTYS